MKMKLEKSIDDMEYAHLHDVLLEASDKDFSNKEIDEIIEKMPIHIKCEAFSAGFSDTCVRDQVFVWYRDKIMKEVNI